MAKIVIDIPDKEIPTKQKIIDISLHFIDGTVCACDYPFDVLPKGCGRLIDADAFKQKVCTYQETGCGSCKHQLCCPEDEITIIEADKGEQ